MKNPQAPHIHIQDQNQNHDFRPKALYLSCLLFVNTHSLGRRGSEGLGLAQAMKSTDTCLVDSPKPLPLQSGAPLLPRAGHSYCSLQQWACSPGLHPLWSWNFIRTNRRALKNHRFQNPTRLTDQIIRI